MARCLSRLLSQIDNTITELMQHGTIVTRKNNGQLIRNPFIVYTILRELNLWKQSDSNGEFYILVHINMQIQSVP